MARWQEQWKPPLSVATPIPRCWLRHTTLQWCHDSYLHRYAFKHSREENKTTFPSPSSLKIDIIYFFESQVHGLIHHWHKRNQVPRLSPDSNTPQRGISFHPSSANPTSAMTLDGLLPWIHWSPPNLLRTVGFGKQGAAAQPSVSHHAATASAYSSSYLPTIPSDHLNSPSDCVNSP